MADKGFAGNSDLYGLGIRIGYYTAAISIWVGNMWAPAEILFLRHVTAIFLIALLVGVSVLAANLGQSYAIETYIILQISYCTYYMGLLAPPGIEYLLWEKEYYNFYTTAIIGLALHGFDTWWWWRGRLLSRRTPGTPTYGLFVYFGQVDIYGYISYPMRVYLVFFIYYVTRECFHHWYYHHLEKKLNYEVPATRLKTMCENWQKELERTQRENAPLPPSPPPYTLSPPSHSRQISSHSLGEISVSPRRSISSQIRATGSESKDDDFGEKSASVYEENVSAPEPGIKRTMSEKLRYRLLGWRPDYNLGVNPVVYTYHPSMETIMTACSFLEFLNHQEKPRIAWLSCFRDSQYNIYAFFIGLPVALLTNPYRLRVILAVDMYLGSLNWKRQIPPLETFRRTLTHPAYRELSPEDIALASRILLTIDPPGKPPTKHILGWAWALLGTCSLMIIGTELAIQWNNISGVQTLKTVGQLIPAAMGVGGLIRTVYSALFERGEEEMLCLNACKAREKKKSWKQAGESWKQAVSAFEKNLDAKKKQKQREIA